MTLKCHLFVPTPAKTLGAQSPNLYNFEIPFHNSGRAFVIRVIHIQMGQNFHMSQYSTPICTNYEALVIRVLHTKSKLGQNFQCIC